MGNKGFPAPLLRFVSASKEGEGGGKLQIIVTCYDEMLTFHNFLQASAYAAVSERADALAGISSLTPKDRGGVIICPRLG